VNPLMLSPGAGMHAARVRLHCQLAALGMCTFSPLGAAPINKMCRDADGGEHDDNEEPRSEIPGLSLLGKVAGREHS
jgi:hypothetical protein